MCIYKEKPDKLNLNVTNSNQEVKIKLDCYFGTVASVSFYHNGLKTINCGEEETIDEATNIKGSQDEFNGKANNPNNQQIRVVHTIYEVGGDSIEYIFPDDYTGNPPYDPNDKNPDYKFFVNYN